MSQWTHINAVIRFDSLRVVGMELPDLGITSNYDGDYSKDLPEATVPCGSEGSMRYHIWENPSASSVAAYTVMFWGDLRDYEDHDEILAYFEKITKGHPIRSGLLEIDIEFQEVYTYRVDHDKWVLLEKKGVAYSTGSNT